MCVYVCLAQYMLCVLYIYTTRRFLHPVYLNSLSDSEGHFIFVIYIIKACPVIVLLILLFWSMLSVALKL